MNPLLLASSSPRRATLLRRIGVHFQDFDPNVDERRHFSESPFQYVERVARLKALAGKKAYPCRLVLAADTVVCLGQKVLGKPDDKSEAISTLEELSGKQHQVITSVILVDEVQKERVATVTTHVDFHHLDFATIHSYVACGEGDDKAGAYAIQGLGSILVRGVSGSLSNVVGLPLEETIALLNFSKVPHVFSLVSFLSKKL